MSIVNSRKRKRDSPHPYLSGNFAPITTCQPLTPCTYTGSIPEELYGGEYIRNGGNPVTNEDLGRDAHWFDGDGMLSGVAFARTAHGIQPEFVNQFILTDVYLSSISSSTLRTPILPSISTLVNPVSTLLVIMLRILRTLVLVLLSHLPGSTQKITRISVANTGILYHDGRALATCESGPPMRVALPGLETVGWYNGKKAEGEGQGEAGVGFGGDGLLSFMREWTTAHPRVDPVSGELIAFHSAFAPPYVHYSIVPATYPPTIPASPLERPTRLLNASVPGIKGAKMMHDFGVSFRNTVILDLPLSLDPTNLARNKPVVSYDPESRSRFGVFPRYAPHRVRWFETDPCCIFHTANSWDETKLNKVTGLVESTAVNMLSCRLTSASIVFAAGDINAPEPKKPLREEDQCRLYYHRFDLSDPMRNDISHEFALTAIPFEFPSLRDERSMSNARYIYGCSISNGTFSAALGRAAKIDCLVKVNATELIYRGKADPHLQKVMGCVDKRTVSEILSSNQSNDPISVFQLPPHHYAQESRFVPRANGISEDDGYLVFYVFDESQLDESGECAVGAKSDLWIIDAREMKTIVAKIHLPQRVPYGLHGNWFPEEQVLGQRDVETIRMLPTASSLSSSSTSKTGTPQSILMKLWMNGRNWVESIIG